MSDEKREAHNLYVQYLAVSADNIGTTDSDVVQQLEETRGRVSMLILQFLCQCRPGERFRHNEFPNIIMGSSRMDGFEVEKATEAFFNLEQYLLLLCLMPWKQEYHRIKKYGGFYQSKIESHLHDAESIFRLVGFTERVSGILMLTHATKNDMLQYIAFECLCAALECRIIKEIWQRTRGRKIHIADVVNIRLHTAGSTDIIVSFIESKYGVAKPTVIMNVTESSRQQDDSKVISDRSKVISDRSPTAPFRNKLQEYMKTAEKLSSGKDADSDIPFMDDDTKEQDLTPGNFDDHLMASLQIVGGKEASPVSSEPHSGIRASQEWSFVREGLEKNYGKKYFEGPRKDLLSDEKEIDVLNKPQFIQNSSNIPVQMPYNKVVQLSTTEATATSCGSRTFPPTISNDSAYASATAAAYASPGAVYPPKYSDQYVPGSLVPPKHDSEVVKRGVSGLHSVTKTAKTEPLARRPVDRDPAPGSHSAYHLTDNQPNIRKHLKRSSLPAGPKDPIVQAGQVGQGSANSSQHSSLSNSAPGRTLHNMYGRVDSVTGSTGSRAGSNVRDGSLNIHVNGTNINVNTNMNRKPDVQTWVCTFCTYVNANNDVICMMCSKTREVEVDSPSAGTQLRVCEKCTLENSTDSLMCSACGHPLKNTQTVV